jgi:ubiquinone biosynthesis protein COQ4
MLRNRGNLADFPKGTLGRSYHDFMVGAAIDEDLYLAGAVEAGLRFERDPHRRWFRTRVEAGHDLRHVLTNYGIDPLGETCLMAFRFGQTGHAGACVIAALGFVVLAFRRQPGLVSAMREAYLRGRGGLLLDLLPWEEMLDLQLADVQHSARLDAPLRYPVSGRFEKPVGSLAGAAA